MCVERRVGTMPEGSSQDEITGKIVALIKAAKATARVLAIVKDNEPRTKDFTQANRAKITIAADDQLEDLQIGGAQ